MPGFGQVYNGQVILGMIFMLWELGSNLLSGLNLSIMESFHGDFQKAHDVIHYEWGMYYPSVWAFSMWQAYNKAQTINAQNEGKQNKEVELTGFFFGSTFGMNMGIYWYIPFVYDASMYLNFLESPVLCGLLCGFIFGWIGHRIEKMNKRVFNV